MAKNVRIDHENTQHNYSGVSMIKTTLLEGGEQRWVPVDEYASYLNKGNLSVTENGTYNPEDHGWDAFSQVTVSIGDGEGVEYDDDGTGADTGFEYIDPDTGLIIDTSTLPNRPTNKIQTNKYKGPGTVTGKDPETGEPTSVSVQEGVILKQGIPDHISVATLPGSVTTYDVGETIEYDTFLYYAWKKSGEPFPIDETQPIPNLIPFNEMEFPYEKAPQPVSGTVIPPDGGGDVDEDLEGGGSHR